MSRQSLIQVLVLVLYYEVEPRAAQRVGAFNKRIAQGDPFLDGAIFLSIQQAITTPAARYCYYYSFYGSTAPPAPVMTTTA